MAKYRKKPVVIEAEQWFPNTGRGFDGICHSVHGDGVIYPALPHIHTLEGILRVSSGDYIITGVQGERYPCKPDIFKATYELVEADY